MTLSRFFKWSASLLLIPLLSALLFIAIFGWNWLRAPIEKMTLDKTGRQLLIGGDLELKFGWPRPRLHTGAVTFANPAWASERQMVSADALDISIDLPQLFLRQIVLPEVRLKHPIIFLEQGSDTRKNWLLDLNQQDESARIRIDRLTLDQGQLGYDDAAQKTHIRAELSTTSATPEFSGLTFSAQGQYKGLALKAQGSGGPVLGLRDESIPYPLKADFTVGQTGVKLDGSITSLLKFSAMDLQLALRGNNLAQLFPLLGIAFPPTRAYTTEGHLQHSGTSWRYDKFSGRIGDSDVAGTLQVDTGGKRAAMKAELTSKVLDLADLAPLIGARPGRLQAARKAAPAAQTALPLPAQARVLPDLPFQTERWNSVNADVTLSANTLRRSKELPLANLAVHLSLRDSVLTLDPLTFGLAGGHLKAVISLDGRQDPIQAKAQVWAKEIELAKLFPTIALNKTSIGLINGEFDLAGTGNSVGHMLANANGNIGLVVSGGRVSKLLMEEAGLHLWEILSLNLTGDKQIKLRCAVADFEVHQGVMRANALIFDTEVTTIIGTGNINLAQEKLNLTLNQKTKNTSPLALRSPIYVRGTLAKPEVGVDKMRVAARALGAIALGVVNPFLTLLPLIDAGPGQDSNCAELLRESRAAARRTSH
jgi:AsmA protein